MTLGFSTKWSKKMGELEGKFTFFPERIWLSLPEEIKEERINYVNKLMDSKYPFLSVAAKEDLRPKKHTIRKNENKKWKSGTAIHFALFNRTKWRVQFAPVIPCVSIQSIKIKYKDLDGFTWAVPRVYIDGVWLTDPTELALNDGFASLEDFFLWFNQDYTGDIIHWTNLKY